MGHKGVNPRTGEAIKIKASKSARLKAGRMLKNSV
ncbi:MAG: HU family DNA-binding protein [Alphaproteobacteria bacterium]|nr:HU family DNA-binding protein [Alphaproteobacteria bacterium]